MEIPTVKVTVEFAMKVAVEVSRRSTFAGKHQLELQLEFQFGISSKFSAVQEKKQDSR
jgi:hypothetical protein